MPRTTAPDAKFAYIGNFGREEEVEADPFVEVRYERDRYVRVALSIVKYKAEPTDVRIAEADVPRHSAPTDGISFNACLNDLVEPTMPFVEDIVCDKCFCCWTRVFKRSSGCKSTEDVKPDTNPAARCDFVETLLCVGFKAGADWSRGSGTETRGFSEDDDSITDIAV